MRFQSSVTFLALLVLPGCFASTISPPPPTENIPMSDAGPVADATVADAPPNVVPVADGAAPDTATPDVAVPDAGPAPVTVRVTNQLGPESGVLIVFQDPSGQVISTGTTDSFGVVTSVVPAGSQVTAVMGWSPSLILTAAVVPDPEAGPVVVSPPTRIELVTVEGAEPGDVLSVVDPSNPPFQNATVSVDSLPDAAPPPGTASYTAEIGTCQTAFPAPPVQIGLAPGCQNNGAYPLLVTAVGGADAGYATLGFTYQNGNTLPLDGGLGHVNMNGSWSTAMPFPAVAVTNDTTSVYTYLGYGEVADGVSLSSLSGVGVDADGGAATTFIGHPGYPAFVQSEANVQTGLYPGQGISAIATRSTGSTDGGTTSFDLSTLLPFISSATLDAGAPDSGVAVSPTVSWEADGGSLASADGVIVVFNWTVTGDAGARTGTWTIVAPPTATSVQAPALPSSVAGWAPPAGATFDPYAGQSGPPTVVVVQASFLSGYAQLRSGFTAVPPAPGLLNGVTYTSPIVPPLPADGTLRLTAYAPGNGG